MSGTVETNQIDSTSAQPVEQKSTSNAAWVQIKNDSTDPATVEGLGYSARVSVTRPNDTAAYTANDVIGTTTEAGGAVIEFTNMGPAAGDIIITDADLEIDVTAVPVGMTSFRLYLYNATIPSALGDNAAFDLPAGDRASFLGYIDLGTPVDIGSTLFVQSSPAKKVRMGATTSLFGYLVTIGGYTPAASVVKRPRLNAIGA